MNILSVENLSKTVNDTPLFENVTLGIEEGEKIGIVGANGAGKSTFLSVLAGKSPKDGGTISISAQTDLVTLTQSVTYEKDVTVADDLDLGYGRKIRLLNEYNEAVKKGDERKYSSLLPLMDSLDVWSLEVDYRAHLTRLALEAEMDRKLSELSGGELKKVAIARTLASDPGLMLLDEPTNHLDIRTITYLEDYLRNTKKSVVIVTHDRYLLNSVCTTVWELDKGTFYRHPGSYEAYLERRAERIEMEQKEQDRLASILRRELKWLQRGPQARTGKDKNRKDRIEAMLSSVKKVQDVRQNQFVSEERRLGKKILECHGIGKGSLFSDFTYLFKKGDRIGIVGDNGSGKSTLLDIMTGVRKPDSGFVDKGINTHFGYYDQLGRDLNTEKTALEYISDIAERIQTGGRDMSASQFLEYFGFPQTRQRTPVHVFSGGEKRRLYLLSKLALNPNFLVLDEPTNDLDIKTMENLEEYISAFPGCVVTVSHDRAFLDCTCDMLFVLKDGKITLFPGSWTAYQESLSLTDSAKKEKPSEVQLRPKREKKGLTFRETKEKEALEKRMDELSDLISRLEESFSSTSRTDDGTLAERTLKYNEAKAELESSEERYLELLEKEQA